MSKVSVLMPVHNGEAFLREAVESIINQTFRDFEFIVIDDGSTDGTRRILASYEDSRIKIVSQEKMGLSKSLNKGLKIARGDYIARMDCDDVSLPDRLEKQVTLMEREHSLGLCGTWVRTFGEGGGDEWKYPLSAEEIKGRLLFESVVAHPTVMMRRKLLVDYDLAYDETFDQAQDYDLWARCARVFSLGNVGEILLLYRLHPTQGGVLHGERKKRLANRIRLRQLEQLGIVPDEREFKIHEALSYYEFEGDRPFAAGAADWLCKLRRMNRERRLYEAEPFEKLLGRYLYLSCMAACGDGRGVWKVFSESPLSCAPDIRPAERFALFVKCFIKYTLRSGASPRS